MIQDNKDGTYTVQYTPEDCGPYNISITFNGEPIKEAPFRTTAIPTGDASKCKITGRVFVFVEILILSSFTERKLSLEMFLIQCIYTYKVCQKMKICVLCRCI
jgi:hypothetical protein